MVVEMHPAIVLREAVTALPAGPVTITVISPVASSEAGAEWEAVLSDETGLEVDRVLITTSEDRANALAVIDAHLICAGRPRAANWSVGEVGPGGRHSVRAKLQE